MASADSRIFLHCDDILCRVCGLDFDFQLPNALLEAARKHEVVIFAGAGISTETPSVFPSTVLEMAAQQLNRSLAAEDSFPAIMQDFETQFGRTELVRLIKRKLDFVDSFRTPRFHATLFHDELATMPYLRDIVTTNWDTYFETNAGCTPLISGEDIPFWELPGRRVLKIHGSITSPGSMVITNDDYTRRLSELKTDAAGAFLRSMLATKVVVFIGYSFSDWHFRELYKALKSDLKAFSPPAYIVSPFEESGAIEFGLTHLKTSGTHFLRKLKSELVGHCNIGDEVYEIVGELHTRALLADPRELDISHKKFPSIIFSGFYNDGMRDATDRILHNRSTGEYSDRHHVINLLHTYDQLQDSAKADDRFGDFAYLEGYISGLLALISDEFTSEENEDLDYLSNVPMYFVYGSDVEITNENDFLSELEKSRRKWPAPRRAAKKLAEGLPEGMVLTHDPWFGK